MFTNSLFKSLATYQNISEDLSPTEKNVFRRTCASIGRRLKGLCVLCWVPPNRVGGGDLQGHGD